MASVPYFLKYKNKQFKYKMFCVLCLFNFSMIKILADKQIKVEKNKYAVDIERIEDDIKPPEEVKNSISPQATKPPLLSNIHSSTV